MGRETAVPNHHWQTVKFQWLMGRVGVSLAALNFQVC